MSDLVRPEGPIIKLHRAASEEQELGRRRYASQILNHLFQRCTRVICLFLVKFLRGHLRRANPGVRVHQHRFTPIKILEAQLDYDEWATWRRRKQCGLRRRRGVRGLVWMHRLSGRTPGRTSESQTSNRTRNRIGVCNCGYLSTIASAVGGACWVPSALRWLRRTVSMQARPIHCGWRREWGRSRGLRSCNWL